MFSMDIVMKIGMKYVKGEKCTGSQHQGVETDEMANFSDARSIVIMENHHFHQVPPLNCHIITFQAYFRHLR